MMHFRKVVSEKNVFDSKVGVTKICDVCGVKVREGRFHILKIILFYLISITFAVVTVHAGMRTTIMISLIITTRRRMKKMMMTMTEVRMLPTRMMKKKKRRRKWMMMMTLRLKGRKMTTFLIPLVKKA
jgi:hypothetical protein